MGYGRRDVWSEIKAIYRSSKKKKDINWFTEWIARPPAAVVVYALRGTPITPNQVTFLSAVLAAVAGAMLVFLPGWAWLVAAILVLEFSFVLDCADGQLARLRKIASPLGHQLDFLMDELKAMLLLGCVAVRVWRDSAGDPWMLIIGLSGLFCLASGIGLTSFMRRPEYGGAPVTEDGQPAQMTRRRGPVGLAIGGLEWIARVLVHYPQYIWICAAVNRIDLFLYVYCAVNALYLARCLLAIVLKLGRFAPRAPVPAPAPESTT